MQNDHSHDGRIIETWSWTPPFTTICNKLLDFICAKAQQWLPGSSWPIDFIVIYYPRSSLVCLLGSVCSLQGECPLTWVYSLLLWAILSHEFSIYFGNNSYFKFFFSGNFHYLVGAPDKNDNKTLPEFQSSRDGVTTKLPLVAAASWALSPPRSLHLQSQLLGQWQSAMPRGSADHYSALPCSSAFSPGHQLPPE